MVLDGARQRGGQFRARVLGGLGGACHTAEAEQVRGWVVRRLLLQAKEEVERGSCEHLCLDDPGGQHPGAVDGGVAQGLLQGACVGSDLIKSLVGGWRNQASGAVPIRGCRARANAAVTAAAGTGSDRRARTMGVPMTTASTSGATRAARTVRSSGPW